MRRHPALVSLSHDHHHVLVIAQQLRRATPESISDVARVFLAAWESEERRHLRLEEELLLPAYAAHGDPAHPVVERILQDHLLIRRDADRVGREPSLELLHDLGSLLGDHVHREERELFPLIETTIPEPDLQALGDRLSAAALSATEPLTTAWSASFGLTMPIVSAPMGGAAGGRLAAAVSSAGGLGMIGIGSAGSIALIEREASIPRDAGLRFGIGLLSWAIDREPTLLDAAIAAEPALIAVSFGAPKGWPDRVRDAGIATATQVYDVSMARQAEQTGVEILVARGCEGGGHGADGLATLPLLQAVLDAVTVPVLGGGGITTGRGLAAVLAAGASGAWLGTVFATCTESMLPDAARRRIVAAHATDTVYTRAFDVAAGYPWPTQYGERVLANEFSARWTGREPELAQDPTARAQFARAAKRGDPALLPINAGQGVAEVRDIRPAADVIHELASGAAALLARSDCS